MLWLQTYLVHVSNRHLKRQNLLQVCSLANQFWALACSARQIELGPLPIQGEPGRPTAPDCPFFPPTIYSLLVNNWGYKSWSWVLAMKKIVAYFLRSQNGHYIFLVAWKKDEHIYCVIQQKYLCQTVTVESQDQSGSVAAQIWIELSAWQNLYIGNRPG